MIDSIIFAIQTLVTEYGATGVFLGALIEEVVSIIPSAAVIMFSGFFILGGTEVNFEGFVKLLLSVSLPVALGLTIGSLFVYGLAYYFGEKFVRRFGKYFGVTWEEIESFERRLNATWYDNVLLFIARSTPFVPFTIINVVCGLIRWSPPSYVFITFVGAFIRGTIVGFMGWQLGSFYKEHLELFDSLERIVMVILALFVLMFLIKRRQKVIAKVSNSNL